MMMMMMMIMMMMMMMIMIMKTVAALRWSRGLMQLMVDGK